jgi:AraC-like DNA-binding protein
VDTHSVTLSTSDVDSEDATAYWRDLICATFVEVAVRPTGDSGFVGRVTHTAVADLGFARLASRSQRVERTRGFVARSQEHHLLANIQLRGRGVLVQEDRHAVLEPGSLTFVDSARPYKLEFADDFAQLVVRVPVSLLPRRTFTDATAQPLSATGPGRLVADFLLKVDKLEPAAAQELMPHTLGLVDTALGWAAGRSAGEHAQAAAIRERVHQFVRRHADDSGLCADTVAAGCRISKRTLFRALADDEPFTELVRRARVERTQQMLLAHPRRTLASIAQACGFHGPAQLHRAFQRVTGSTPGMYRAGVKRSDGA